MEKGGCTSKIKRDTISVIKSVIMCKKAFFFYPTPINQSKSALYG